MGAVLSTRCARRALKLIALATAALVLAGCEERRPGSDEAQVQRGQRAIANIPQDGVVLGRPQAPWTLTAIAAATSFELDQLITLLPEITDDYVRPGRLKLRMLTPSDGAYVVDDNERAAAALLFAAGEQNHYWDALVRLVPTYDGDLEQADLKSLLRRSGVRRVMRALDQLSGPRIRAQIEQANADASAAVARGGGVHYLLGRADARPKDISVDVALGRLAATLATELG